MILAILGCFAAVGAAYFVDMLEQQRQRMKDDEEQ